MAPGGRRKSRGGGGGSRDDARRAECQSAVGPASAAPPGTRLAWRGQALQPGVGGVKVAEQPGGNRAAC